jgi:hypothetical protein
MAKKFQRRRAWREAQDRFPNPYASPDYGHGTQLSGYTIRPPSLGSFTWPRDALLCAGLALLIAVAYWPVAGNDFINYDDEDYVFANEFVNQGLTVNHVVWAMTAFHEANWHPLTWLSHMLDCQVFGIVQVGGQSMADRYSYLPLVGIFVRLAWSAAEAIERWPRLKLPMALLTAAALLVCCLLTSGQVRLWASTESLFTHTAAVTKDNTMALTNLGLVASHKENYAEAERLYRAALQLEPANIFAMGNLASMFIKTHQPYRDQQLLGPPDSSAPPAASGQKRK